MTVTIASWYVAALIRASIHVNALLTLVLTAAELIARGVYIALITFFMGTGATRFLLDTR